MYSYLMNPQSCFALDVDKQLKILNPFSSLEQLDHVIGF